MLKLPSLAFNLSGGGEIVEVTAFFNDSALIFLIWYYHSKHQPPLSLFIASVIKLCLILYFITVI